MTAVEKAALAPEAAAHIAGMLDRAGRLCEQRGARLTELRRQVLALILDSHAPVGAYDLLDRLRASRSGAAPPTVYRALDFLQEHGLIHRIERLAAFVGCVEGHAHSHAAQFLICRRCGAVAELDDHELTRALTAAALRAGFSVTGATVEAEGVCGACAASEAAV